MGEQEIESGRIEENEGSVVATSKKAKPRKRIIKMKGWNDTIYVRNPDGIDFITLSYEQLTVYARFISSTTICANKENVKVEDKTDDKYVYTTYIGQEFHR